MDRVTTWQIIPDARAENVHVEAMWAALSVHRRPLSKRVARAGRRVKIGPQVRIYWKAMFTTDSIRFFLTAPRELSGVVHSRLRATWPTATVREADYEQAAGKILCLRLKENPCFSLRLLKESLEPLDGYTTLPSLLLPGERAAVEVSLEPVLAHWQSEAAEALDHLRKTGRMPRVQPSGLSRIAWYAMDGLGAVCASALEFVTTVLDPTAQPELDWKGEITRQPRLTPETVAKATKAGYRATVTLWADAPEAHRKDAILGALHGTFRALDGDNQFEAHQLPESARFRNPSILGAHEIARLTSIPTLAIQERCRAVERVAVREGTIPEGLQGSVVIGTATKQGVDVPVGFSIGTTDRERDLAVKPLVVVGPPGSGKTTLAVNLALKLHQEGANAVLLDPSTSGEASRLLRDAMPSEEDYVELDFGATDHPIAIPFGARDLPPERSAAEIMAFLTVLTGDPGRRTRRWLKKAVHSSLATGGTVLEAIRLLLDDEYRASLMPSLPPDLQLAWVQFAEGSEGWQREIVDPVLNRTEYLMDDPTLKAIICQRDAKLNMDALFNSDRPKVISALIPSLQLSAYGANVVAALLTSQIWLSMLQRDRSSRPTYLLMDEPHQYLAGGRLWERMITEGRKYRFCAAFLFHDWAQLRRTHREFTDILQAGDPNYLLFQSSEANWRELKETIYPLTIQEAMRLPQYHALAVLHTLDGRPEPIIVRTLPDPERVADRTAWSQKSLRTYGRPRDLVLRDITQREGILNAY